MATKKIDYTTSYELTINILRCFRPYQTTTATTKTKTGPLVADVPPHIRYFASCYIHRVSVTLTIILLAEALCSASLF
jgi:hypothetical protein